MKQFRLPDLGEGVHEGQIVRLLVRAGERVVEDQPLMEVETDKAAVEIPSPFTGTVSAIHVSEQQVVNTGDVLIDFEEGEAAPAKSAAAEAKQATASGGGREQRAPTGTTATAAPTSTPRRPGKVIPASPAVRRLARQLGLELGAIDGSGPRGRVTRRDVEQASANGGASTRERRAAPSAPPPRPAVRPAQPSAPPPGEAGEDAWGPVTIEPLSRPRQTIAANMTRSWTTIPHVTDSFDADVTDLDRLRREANDGNPDLPKLSLLPFVVRAVAICLGRHPLLNAEYDEPGGRIIHKGYVHIAVGVHTERGLIAPVLRNADRLDVRGIAAGLDELAAKARGASFAVNDLRGGSFTISNAGAMGGSRYSTPIINAPQVAVLAIGRSRQQPWVVDGAVVPRLIMPLSLSFDHRIIDGGTEILFQRELVALLEQPGRMVL